MQKLLGTLVVLLMVSHPAFAQGKLVVAFSTTNETSIVGFNVYSGAEKLNGKYLEKLPYRVWVLLGDSE